MNAPNGEHRRESERTTGLTHRDAAWADLRVLVTGLGLSGFAAADALLDRGAHVVVVDGQRAGDQPCVDERATILDLLGADVRLGPEQVETLPDTPVDLVVTSPGWPPHHRLLRAAVAVDVPIWGDVELAWRMRPAQGAAPWLTLTGTNGKTTTVQMLTSMLRAAGLRAASAGNVGTPILDLVRDPQPFDVLAVELSSFQLHWSHSLAPLASACLNVAPDHVDWHGSYAAYLEAKGRVYTGTQVACVYNVEDPQTRALVEAADVQEGARAIGFTLGVPGVSMVGLVDDVLADRAFVEQRATSAAELATIEDVRGHAPTVAPHQVANALAAAALARAHGIPAGAVRQGLRDFTPEPHRIAEVAVVGGVRYVDDSKATNAHAAQASLAAFESIVWIAGGLLKGASVDDVVAAHAPRLRGVVLMGRDRASIATALARHAPEVPVIDIATTDTGAMDEVIAAAASLARPGDVVLLAPAAASMDMFAHYGARGDAFAEAVHAIAGGGRHREAP